MIQHDDLHRYCQSSDTKFDNEQTNQIIYHADLHLIQRGFSGFFIIPLLYFIIGFTSSFSIDYFMPFYGGATILVIASLGRVHSGLKLRSPTLLLRTLWQRYYYFTSLVTALCWGLLAATFLYHYAASWENVIILFMTAGIAGGSISSYSNWLSLNRFYLLILLGPIIIVSFLFAENHLMVVGILFTISLVYNLGQVKLWNSIYWNSLINTYLLKNEVAARQESQVTLQAITENIPGVVFQFYASDTGETGFHYVSPKLFDIFGLGFIDDPSLYLQTFVQNIHEDDRQFWVDSVQNAIEKQIPWNWKGRYVKSSGEIIWFEGKSTSTVRKDEIVFDGIFFDTTNVKKLEKEKYQTEIQLHRAHKMESIGLMAGGVAHDLNNILSGIIGYPELLLKTLPKDSELRAPIEAIHESGQRAATVVADLLTVARGVAIRREEHDLNTLIVNYLNSPECKKLNSLHPNITCLHQSESTNSIISCSPVHIQKCIMNLVTNGCEAIAGAGTITLSTYNQDINEKAISKHEIEAGEYVVLNVKDTGSGISKEDIEHIFEPFYTKKVMGKSGSGLGLAVVWNTMEDHDGKVIVNSTEKGTSFQLYFPVKKGSIVSQFGKEHDPKITGGDAHILVVDDEPQLRDIARMMLENLGYSVGVVESGESAIEFVRKRPVDLLLIDMLMEPGMSGRQTYEEITKLYPNQKAVVASGFSESEDVKATLQLGAGGFIMKPYSTEQLGRVVKEVLDS